MTLERITPRIRKIGRRFYCFSAEHKQATGPDTDGLPCIGVGDCVNDAFKMWETGTVRIRDISATTLEAVAQRLDFLRANAA